MAIRNFSSPFGSHTLPVDARIGNAYPYTELVGKHIEHIRFLAENFEKLRPRDIEFRDNPTLRRLEWRHTDVAGEAWKELATHASLLGADIPEVLAFLVETTATVQADAVQVAADKIVVAQDKALVAADKITVAQDAAQVADNRNVVDERTDLAMGAAGAAEISANAAYESADSAATDADIATTSKNTAVSAKDAALVSQNAAAVSATTATTKAAEAVTSATTATTKAGEASTSAATASTKAAEAEALVSSYQAVLDGAGAGKFPAGTAEAPSLRAAADENTGVNLPGSDVLQLVTGGVVRLTVAADGTPSGDVATKAPVSIPQAEAIALAVGGVGSLIAAPGKVPLADDVGRLDISWFDGLLPNTAEANFIGVPGQAGFGVGICPEPPAGYVALPGCLDPLTANYGNYQYSDGSIMCWIPAFYFRLGHPDNPTYGVYGANSIDVKPVNGFPDEATANASEYYLHRAFINAGATQLGFFRDKYDCSNNAGTASSIASGMPLASDSTAGNSPFDSLTGAPTNAHYGAIPAAKTRGAKFFPETIFISDALCRLTEAHGQASSSSTRCAWFDATGVTNFPKGNNAPSLSDISDPTVTFVSAGAEGAPSMALSGSGSPLDKTTHNGQLCGVTDVNGNMFKLNFGITCVAIAKDISGVANTNPVSLTVVGHGRATGDTVKVDSVGGISSLNSKIYTITVVDADHVTLDGTDGTSFGAYTSGGEMLAGTFYTLKPSADIAAVTSGTSSATDHWGAAGLTAQFDVFPMKFASAYPNNGYAQRYGNGTNPAFSMATANDRIRSMMGMPATGGVSAAGTNLFGLDNFYQDITNDLCMITRGRWGYTENAGSRYRDFGDSRSDGFTSVGFAAASYL